MPPAQLGPQIDQTLQIPAGAALTRGILGDVHARLVGARSAPVVISPTDMVQLVRDQVVATVPAAPLPVETIPWLDTVRRALTFFVPIAALAGVVALVFGFIAHPRRADAVFGVGMFCVFAAVLGALLGYVVPAFLLPALDDDPWMAIVPAVANDQLPLIAGVSVALAVLGGALILASTGFRKRKTRSWSSPGGHDPLLRPAPLELTAPQPDQPMGASMTVPTGWHPSVGGRRRYDVSSSANSANTSA